MPGDCKTDPGCTWTFGCTYKQKQQMNINRQNLSGKKRINNIYIRIVEYSMSVTTRHLTTEVQGNAALPVDINGTLNIIYSMTPC